MQDSPKGVAVMPSSMISISIVKVEPPNGAIRDIIAEKVKLCSKTNGGALRLNTAAERRESYVVSYMYSFIAGYMTTVDRFH